MNFKEWLRLDEIIHVSFTPTKIDGVSVDAIDFRFEDWSKGSKSASNHIQAKVSPAPFISGSFSAKLDNGMYLNYSPSENLSTDGGTALMLAPGVKMSAEPQFRPLPAFWKKFSIWYSGNDITKYPEWTRPGEQPKQQLLQV